MTPFRFVRPWLGALSAAALLSGCGDGGSCNPCGPQPVTITFNGSVSGLAASTSLVLGDTTGVSTTVSANGSFTYQTYAWSYATPPLLGVLVQPTGQDCALSTGTPSSTGAIAVTATCAAVSGTPSQVSLLAGSMTRGSGDGTGSAASFANPSAIAADASGNLYVADSDNNTIRMITPGGVVTTLAGAAGTMGSTDGTGAAARFNNPNGIAIDASGNLYVADTGNQTIRLVTPAGVVTTIAGTAGIAGTANGTGAAATFYWPMGIAVNAAGTLVYVTDFGDQTVRVLAASSAPMTPAATMVSTLAGTAGSPGTANGVGAIARFYGPQGIALDASGNLYVADSWSNTIRYIVTSSATVSTYTGTAGVSGAANGALTAATFNVPLDIKVDSAGDLYVADAGNSLIRKISVSGGTVSSVVGSAGQDVFNAGPLPGSIWQPTSLVLTGTAPAASLAFTAARAVATVNNVP